MQILEDTAMMPWDQYGPKKGNPKMQLFPRARRHFVGSRSHLHNLPAHTPATLWIHDQGRTDGCGTDIGKT